MDFDGKAGFVGDDESRGDDEEAHDLNWQACMAEARSELATKQSTGLWISALDRIVGRYSADADEQAAYEFMCERTFELGELLRNQPFGTFIRTQQGQYWLSEAAGPLRVYFTPDDAFGYGISVFEATWCDGIGDEDLNEIARYISEAIAVPELHVANEPVLLDALVSFEFKS